MTIIIPATVVFLQGLEGEQGAPGEQGVAGKQVRFSEVLKYYLFLS